MTPKDKNSVRSSRRSIEKERKFNIGKTGITLYKNFRFSRNLIQKISDITVWLICSHTKTSWEELLG
jgi:hypothetical protein